jgi:hypothetical protein
MSEMTTQNVSVASGLEITTKDCFIAVPLHSRVEYSNIKFVLDMMGAKYIFQDVGRE